MSLILPEYLPLNPSDVKFEIFVHNSMSILTPKSQFSLTTMQKINNFKWLRTSLLFLVITQNYYHQCPVCRYVWKFEKSENFMLSQIEDNNWNISTQTFIQLNEFSDSFLWFFFFWLWVFWNKDLLNTKNPKVWPRNLIFLL